MAKRAIRDLVLEMNREEGVTVLLTSTTSAISSKSAVG